MRSAGILGSLIFIVQSYYLIAQTSLLDGVLQALEGETDFRRDDLDK